MIDNILRLLDLWQSRYLLRKLDKRWAEAVESGNRLEVYRTTHDISETKRRIRELETE